MENYEQTQKCTCIYMSFNPSTDAISTDDTMILLSITIFVHHLLCLLFVGRPDSPTDVRTTEKTSDSITVSWTAGYDGGEDQWFIVSHLKTNSDDTEEFSDRITGGENMYTVTGLEGHTEYEIRIYAENKISRTLSTEMITVTTLRKY